MARHFVFRFYAELKDYKPKIWRRFEINGEKTMAELGYAVMLMFEMHASHLFCFKEGPRDTLLPNLRSPYNDEIEREWNKPLESDMAKNLLYALPDDDIYISEGERLIAANEITLQRITDSPGWKLLFEYDYGDGWEVNLTLEACEKREVSLAALPRVIDGEGFGIVEDVGGVGGLAELAKNLKKGKGKACADAYEWLDSTSLDLESFDADDMNFRLKKLIRAYREFYEYDYQPTKRSLGLLLREYQGKGSRGY
jgi:hypothetical protein